MQIAGCSALVTGGAGGLGAATAKALAAAGATVVVADLKEGSEPGVTYLRTDVTNETDVREAVATASAVAPLRIVVNCAGIIGAERAVGREGAQPLEHFERVIRINLTGTFNVIRIAAEQMQTNDDVGEERGVIVNTASVAAFDGQIGQPAYAASKGAVASMTLPLAREFARNRIRVMTIAPGIFATDMMASLSQEAQDSLGPQAPHPSRLGHPAEYAQLVQSIVENPMLNGEVIRLDGAIRMTPK
ncbi:SDR family NAD(P)-dependent oxidoreductase [Agrococcus casei]|uniref:3-hydroxyacyl-CoA dehydrogenase n=1 Tax=Agrococcus casei LMG 22410 TaxID=1255656 RepID=A0A1R4GC01_9MICO|nr:SDR family NAD(P)-dependent oxidoreductase [Agrococcus casei]SJM65739.1 3-hydroxyacyl-CoA dehydrogenase [Agrococcus casei LMG 22410]